MVGGSQCDSIVETQDSIINNIFPYTSHLRYDFNWVSPTVKSSLRDEEPSVTWHTSMSSATSRLQYSRLARCSLRNTPYCASAFCSLYHPPDAVTNAPFEGRLKYHLLFVFTKPHEFEIIITNFWFLIVAYVERINAFTTVVLPKWRQSARELPTTKSGVFGHSPLVVPKEIIALFACLISLTTTPTHTPCIAHRARSCSLPPWEREVRLRISFVLLR